MSLKRMQEVDPGLCIVGLALLREGAGQGSSTPLSSSTYHDLGLVRLPSMEGV